MNHGPTGGYYKDKYVRNTSVQVHKYTSTGVHNRIMAVCLSSVCLFVPLPPQASIGIGDGGCTYMPAMD